MLIISKNPPELNFRSFCNFFTRDQNFYSKNLTNVFPQIKNNHKQKAMDNTITKKASDANISLQSKLPN